MLDSFDVPNARVDVGTGLVLDGQGAIVQETRHVRTGPRAVDLPLRPDTPVTSVESPLVVASNSVWQNHYHWVIQTLFPVWEWVESSEHEDAQLLTPILSPHRRESLYMTGLVAGRHHQAPMGALSTPRAIVLRGTFNSPHATHCRFCRLSSRSNLGR